MRLDRTISLGLSAFKWDHRKCPIAILMYHSISNRTEADRHPYYKTVTPPERFSEQMDWLAEAGAEVVDLEHWNTPLAPGKKLRVIITFDDGFSDFLSNAFPVLRRHAYPATVFLPTAFIGSGKELINGIKHLEWEEVIELNDAGVRFGSHTSNHHPLETLTRRQIREEVHASAQSILSHLGERVIAFSCPFAFPQAHPETISALREELINCGYTISVTTKIGTVSPLDDPLSLRRIPVNSDDDKHLFMTKIKGGYDWLGQFQHLARRAKKTFHF